MHEPASPAPLLTFAAGMTGGIVVAMATATVLGHYGIELSGAWRGLFAAQHADLRAALAWWAIAGTALGGGFLIAFATGHLEWRRMRFLRGWLAAPATFLLAVIAREVAPAAGATPATFVAVNLAAVVTAGVMAAFGSYFAIRR